ncbi:MAG: 50S ribosomal protein L19e [Candidatus Altiarchaeales archaeon A3]|nr:MAG: 50S ribosomal protein L19e [Candidatus Altiarchaeales archaeon A3]
MNVKNQKNLTARLFGVGKGRVYLNPLKLEEIKKAITRNDIKKLTDVKVEIGERRPIEIMPKNGVCRAKARHREAQKAKGRQRGCGNRKGTFKARTDPKTTWITKIRALRNVLVEMRSKKEINTSEYRKLYLLAKGNFFRNKKHLGEYVSGIKKNKEIIK